MGGLIHCSAQAKLAYKPVRVIDDKRVEAVTEEYVAEHIARIRAAITRYNIKDARHVFNMDQSGASFSKMTGRSLRKGIGPRHVALVHSAVRTKGNLERVTVVPVVSAAGIAYTPVVVYPGVQAHLRRARARVRGQVQTLHSFLPTCYLYQREVPGVDSEIIYDWAQKLISETAVMRANHRYILLVIDGYGSHVQLKTLQLFKEHRVIVIAMPSHTSHVLQPLDVSVFSSCKSYLQKEIHSMASRKKILDAFDISCCIHNAYSSSLTSGNIISGFYRTGIWDETILNATAQPLKKLFFNDENNSGAPNVKLDDLLHSFSKTGRSLLRDADVEENGTVKIGTKRGAHLTSDAVVEALQKRNEKRRSKSGMTEEQRERKNAYKEPKEKMTSVVWLSLLPNELSGAKC